MIDGVGGKREKDEDNVIHGIHLWNEYKGSS
jgi:hypothetical protein